MSETYYHIENALQRGDRDEALSLANEGLDDVLWFYVEDGFSDADVLILVQDKLGSVRAEQ